MIQSNSSSHWQHSLDSQWVQRLLHPLNQPGLIKLDIGQGIIRRSDRFLARLPLLSQQLQRWHSVNELSVESVPIVYAQSRGVEARQTELSPGSPEVQALNFTLTDKMPVPVNRVPSDTFNDTFGAVQARNDSPNDTFAAVQAKNDSPVVTPQPTVNAIPGTSNLPLQAKRSVFSPAIATSSKSMPSPASSNAIQSPSASIEGSKTPTPLLSAPEIVVPLSVLNPVLPNRELSLTHQVLRSSEPLPIAQAIAQSARPSAINRPLVKVLPSPLVSRERPNKASEPTHLIPLSSLTDSSSTHFSRQETPADAFPLTSESNQQRILPIVKSTTTANPQPLRDRLPVVSANQPENIQAKAPPLLLATKTTPGQNASSLPQKQNLEQVSPLPQIFAASAPPSETAISTLATPPPRIDLDALTHQVERKLMRRLVIESERRGKAR